jgi:hypothetical protein
MDLLASRLFFVVLLMPLAVGAEGPEAVASVPTPSLRAERMLLESGAELVTLFERLPNDARHRELPLLAILKDTMGDSDPSNDRIRQVWVFTYSQPSIWQRIAGGIPFLYHRAGLDRGPGSKPPRAVVDLGDPSRGMWAGLGFAAVQSEVLNPIGAWSRLTTHSFFGNYGEYRKTHIWEAADLVSTLRPAGFDSGLTPEEIEAVEERLELAGHPFGGFVADQYLGRDHERQRSRQTETRGHNWELLRQCAEDAGLYLQAPEVDGLPASVAILWVAQTDLDNVPGRSFDRKFLNISNPFSDQALRHWHGYSETWNFDPNGVPVAADTEGAHPVQMIPLALYGLDHPRTPILLVDFRGPGHPPRREIGLKLAEDATTGVLSLSGVGAVGYLAVKSSWMFVETRHGGATDRLARRRAFVFVRHTIGSDSSLQPKLRAEMLNRIEKVDVNPVEHSWDQEVRDSWQQYDALIAYARKTGLAREIERDRGDEMQHSVHSKSARIGLAVASIGTAGLYRHHDTLNPTKNPTLMAELDRRRHSAWLSTQTHFLPPVGDPIANLPASSPAVASTGIEQ